MITVVKIETDDLLRRAIRKNGMKSGLATRKEVQKEVMVAVKGHFANIQNRNQDIVERKADKKKYVWARIKDKTRPVIIKGRVTKGVKKGFLKVQTPDGRNYIVEKVVG